MMRSLLRSAAAFLFFLAGAVLVTRPLALHAATHTIVGPDPLSHLWMVSWLTGHAFDGRLFGGNIFHPATSAVLFTDLSLGTAILVLPLRLFTSEPLVLFNAATLIAFAFGGWAFHALVHGITGNRWAGLLAGWLAALSQHQLSHVYHLNLLSIGWLALFLLGLHRLVERPGWKAAALAGVAFALNAQSSGYYGVAALVIALVFAGAHARRLIDPKVAGAAAGAAAIALALTLPYLVAFRAARAQHGLDRPPGVAAKMSFRPGRDLTSWAWAHRAVLPATGELLFPGLLTLGLAAAAVVRRARASTFYAAAAAVLVVLSLGPDLDVGPWTVAMPYRWLAAIPPFDSMRHPFTFAAVALFLLAVLAGLGWARLPIASRRGAGPVVLALAAFEQATDPVRLREVPPGVPPAYRLLQTLPPGPVLEVPLLADETVVWAARHGRPVANGIAAFVPAQTLVLDRYIRGHWLETVPEDVDASRPTPYLVGRFGVRYVILPLGRKFGLRHLAAAFDRSRTFRLVAVAGDGDRIYEVVSSP
jgi:hypothetical protein